MEPVEEFKFKIARARDLPPSWFELVLCPDKFRAHLKTLEGNPEGGGSLQTRLFMEFAIYLYSVTCM